MELELSEETLINFGGEIKALGNPANDDYKIGGYLVRFGTEKDTDLEGEFFTSDTDFGLPVMEKVAVPVMYHHGLDSLLGKAIIGKGQITKDDVGLWFEAQLELNDQYVDKLKQAGVIKSQLKSNAKYILGSLYKSIQKGKFGWSSGTKFAEREKTKSGANWLKTWHIAEGTITPTPAEFRNTVQSIKSFKALLDEYQETGSEDEKVFEEKAANENPQVENSKAETVIDDSKSDDEKIGSVMSNANLATLKGLCDTAKNLSNDLLSFHKMVSPKKKPTSKFYELEVSGKLDKSVSSNHLMEADGYSVAYHVHRLADLLYYNSIFIDLNSIADELERLAALVLDANQTKAVIDENYLMETDGWSIAYHVHRVADLLYYDPQYIDLSAINSEMMRLAGVIRDANTTKQDDTKTVSESQSQEKEFDSNLFNTVELEGELFKTVNLM